MAGHAVETVTQGSSHWSADTATPSLMQLRSMTWTLLSQSQLVGGDDTHSAAKLGDEGCFCIVQSSRFGSVTVAVLVVHSSHAPLYAALNVKLAHAGLAEHSSKQRALL